MACGRLAKDVQYLQRHIGSQTNGQAKVIDVDDNLEFLLLNFTPNDGYYKGAKLKFKIAFSTCYPDEVPRVMCLDDVYHPNIDPSDSNGAEEGEESSNVCVSLLDEWEPSMGLDHVVMAVLFLLYNPNPGDALSPYFDADMEPEDLEENIRKALRGEDVEGTSWPRLLVDDDEDDSVREKEDRKDGELVSDLPVQANADGEQNKDGCGEIVKTDVGETAKTSPVQGSAPSSDAGSKDADGSDPVNDPSTSGVSKETLLDTAALNHQNSAVTEALAQMFKDCPVIFADAADRDCKNSDAKSYNDSLGIGRLWTCSGCRMSRIKALFSCFHRRNAGVQFQATSAGVFNDLGDCDVD